MSCCVNEGLNDRDNGRMRKKHRRITTATDDPVKAESVVDFVMEGSGRLEKKGSNIAQMKLPDESGGCRS